MRSSKHRLDKYKKKLDYDIPPKSAQSQADQYAMKLSHRQGIERLIKSLKLSPILEHYYLAYAEQIQKIKDKHSGSMALDEIQIRLRDWYSRGLTGPTLNTIAEKMGITGLAVPGETVTFGNTHIGPNVMAMAGNFIIGTRYYFSGPRSRLDKLTIYMRTYGIWLRFKCAVYNAPGNSPTSRIAITEEKLLAHGALAWIDFNIIGDHEIDAGWYYLVFWSDSGFMTRADPGTNDRGVVAQGYHWWPDPIVGWIPNTNRDYSIYATCETV